MGKVEVNRNEIAQETSDKVVPGAGLYRHPNGTEAITLYDPLFGNAQSEAFVRLGFEFVREATADEIKSIVEVNIQNREAPVVNQSVESTQAVAAEAKDKELEELRAYKAQKEAEEAEATDAAKKADEEAKAKAEADAKAKADADKKAADEKAKADAAKKAADEKEGK